MTCMLNKRLAILSSLLLARPVGAATPDFPRTVDLTAIEAVGNDANLPLVVIVTTGGTIAQMVDATTGAATPAVSGADLVAAMPGLSALARVKVIEFSNMDSAWMSPAAWECLGELLLNILGQEADGVVITHGTDTMSDTAYFLDLILDTGKPVVVTGAMRNADAPDADGPGNLYNAVAQAASPDARNWGVTVNMHDCIHAARHVRKAHSIAPNAFTSGAPGMLGTVHAGKITRRQEIPPTKKYPLPHTLPRVPLIRSYAGDDGALIRHAADQGVAGLVIEALGSGNVNPATAEAIQYALDKNIPVVIASVCEAGGAHPLYGSIGGGADLQKRGARLAPDLPGHKARIRLMLEICIGNKS